jgi:Fe-S-cluster containining protein
MKCRIGCGACCIAPFISSPIPGMPNGKPAGERCVQLSEQNTCLLYEKAERPAVCVYLRPSRQMCGSDRKEAIEYLRELEEITKPELF